MAPIAEAAVLAAGRSEASDELASQVSGLDDVVDHQFTGQPDDVDVFLVLRPLGGDERLALIFG